MQEDRFTRRERDMQSTLQDNQLMLPLSGRIDFSSRQHLCALINDGLTKGYTDFILDLHDVSSVDSAGFRALLACSSLAQKHGGHLALTRVPKRISDLMALTRLTCFFEICDPAHLIMSSVNQ
jgi:anti-anti-sigma factor